MGDVTTIGWTATVLDDGTVLPGHTFNPWLGCQRVSPACGGAKGVGGCYAEAFVTGRMGYNPTSNDPRRRLTVWGPPSTSTRPRTSPENWKKPLKWDREAKASGIRRKVFCASLADVFEDHPDLPAVRADLWPLIERCDGLDWQLLTKRPQHIRDMVPPAWLRGGWPAHVWIGTTVEDQKRAMERIHHLLGVPAVVRFLSIEPMLEPIDLSLWLKCRGCKVPGRFKGCECRSKTLGLRFASDDWCNCYCHNPIGQIIVGGESGPGARSYDLAWARSIVAQCDAAGVPVFVKQGGDHAVLDSTRLKFKAHHGADPAEWPEDLRRQSFPAVSR